MDSASLMSIRVIPKSVKEETGHHALERLHHTPYRDEVRLFSCLQRGDLKKLIYELGQIGIQNITVGQMSENDLQQQKYMAVSFITLATRYAIQGGLGESNAYAYSDDFIRRIALGIYTFCRVRCPHRTEIPQSLRDSSLYKGA